MRLSTAADRDEARGIEVLHAALDAGVTLFDTANAYCSASLLTDDETRQRLWDGFRTAPEPVGYDPAIIPGWSDGPLSPAFAALRLEPWRLYVRPAAVLLEGKRELVQEWRG